MTKLPDPVKDELNNTEIPLEVGHDEVFEVRVSNVLLTSCAGLKPSLRRQQGAKMGGTVRDLPCRLGANDSLSGPWRLPFC